MSFPALVPLSPRAVVEVMLLGTSKLGRDHTHPVRQGLLVPTRLMGKPISQALFIRLLGTYETKAASAIAGASDTDNAVMRPEVVRLILELWGDIAASAVAGGSTIDVTLSATGACDCRPVMIKRAPFGSE